MICRLYWPNFKICQGPDFVFFNDLIQKLWIERLCTRFFTRLYVIQNVLKLVPLVILHCTFGIPFFHLTHMLQWGLSLTFWPPGEVWPISVFHSSWWGWGAAALFHSGPPGNVLVLCPSSSAPLAVHEQRKKQEGKKKPHPHSDTRCIFVTWEHDETFPGHYRMGP